MAAILRVKRRNDGEPLDALLVACKRPKTDNSETDEATGSTPITAVVKFAGTIQNQEENIVEHIKKTLSKDQLKANYKQRIVDLSEKVRNNRKQTSQENRYKIVNSMRSVDTSGIGELENTVISVIDIEDSISCAPQTNASHDEEDNYVYDLYYANDVDDLQWESLVSVHNCPDLSTFDEYRDEDKNFEYGESDDSNSESNWRNDYPDSDHSASSIIEEDMIAAVQNIDLEDELSTDDDDFAYGLDNEDVDRYGYKYAKYKARIRSEINGDTDSIKSDELSDDSESEIL